MALDPIWTRKHRSQSAQISSQLLVSQSMRLLVLTTMNGLSCVPAIPASTQGWTSERAIAVVRRNCVLFTLGSRIIRGHVKPRSHKGFGCIEVALGCSTRPWAVCQQLPHSQINFLSGDPRLIAGIPPPRLLFGQPRMVPQIRGHPRLLAVSSGVAASCPALSSSWRPARSPAPAEPPPPCAASPF